MEKKSKRQVPSDFLMTSYPFLILFFAIVFLVFIYILTEHALSWVIPGLFIFFIAGCFFIARKLGPSEGGYILGDFSIPGSYSSQAHNQRKNFSKTLNELVEMMKCSKPSGWVPNGSVDLEFDGRELFVGLQEKSFSIGLGEYNMTIILATKGKTKNSEIINRKIDDITYSYSGKISISDNQLVYLRKNPVYESEKLFELIKELARLTKLIEK